MKTEKILFGILTLTGIFVVCFGIKLHQINLEFLETAQVTTAQITDIDSYTDSDGDRHYSVMVEFAVDNQIYTGQLGLYSSNMSIGEDVTVYYNPNNPDDFKNSASKASGYIVIGIGVIFFLIGTIPLINSFKHSHASKKFKETGTLIEAQIERVYLNTNYSVNGRHPYRLSAHAQLPNSEKIYTFESENVWGNLQAVVETHQIEKVNVYIDLNNPKKYCVDLEEIKSYMGN